MYIDMGGRVILCTKGIREVRKVEDCRIEIQYEDGSEKNYECESEYERDNIYRGIWRELLSDEGRQT